MNYKIISRNKNAYFIKCNKKIRCLKKKDLGKTYKVIDDNHVELLYNTKAITDKYQYLTRNLKNIQKSLGYTFKNVDLLKYAFLRQDAADVLNISGHCEVLEFLGDRLLYCISFKRNIHSIMNDKKAFLENDTSETFNMLFKQNTNATFFEIVKDSGLDKYMVGTTTMAIQDDKAIADLYEAIIGAIAIDSNWNLDTLYKVSEKLIKNVPKNQGLLARIEKMGY